MHNQIFEQALGLESPWYIKSVEFSKEDKRLDINIDFTKGSTFEYEDQGSFKAYDTIKKSWRHLNFFEHECYINCRVPRVKLDDGKVKRIKAPWEGVNSGFTLLFEALIMQMASCMPVQNVADIINEDDEKIWRILHKYVERSREDIDMSEVSVIGVDETSQAKHHNYVTVFVDMNKRKTLYVTDGKDNTTVVDFVKDLELHNGDANNITAVSSDMSPAFIKGINENLPNATITFDRFHVMNLISKAVDEVRIEEAKTNPLLYRTKYIFLKNRVNLTDKQEEFLGGTLELKKHNLKTVRALHLRESFQAIYQATSKSDFTRLLNEWYNWARRCRLEPMKKAATSIKKHWYGIVSWFDSKLNNGILEGMNSVIQAAKRKARGYSTTKNYKTIIYLLTAGLDFTKINAHVKNA